MNIVAPPMPLEQGSRDVLICFSHLRWNFVYQRPQHLLRRATIRYEVFFWEEPVFGEEREAWLDRTMSEEGVEILVPRLPHMDWEHAIIAQRKLLDQFLSQLPAEPSALWYYTPMALQFSRGIPADVIVYDNMDELSAFHGAPPEVIALENEMFAASDVVFTGGQSLFEAKKHRHKNIHPFPSSIETAHFHKARRATPDPVDQLSLPRPRLGFFGVVDERMDIDLLARAAALRPNWQFVMVGPVVKIDPQILPKAANIHWLGPKNYKELPSYLAYWDLGLMPFALNDATRFISPTKTPEFLAAGIPVLSTRIKDVVRPYGENGLVEIVDDAEDLCHKAEALLNRPKEPWLTHVDQFLALNSWDQTWAAMQGLMEKANPQQKVVPILEVTHA